MVPVTGGQDMDTGQGARACCLPTPQRGQAPVSRVETGYRMPAKPSAGRAQRPCAHTKALSPLSDPGGSAPITCATLAAVFKIRSLDATERGRISGRP